MFRKIVVVYSKEPTASNKFSFCTKCRGPGNVIPELQLIKEPHEDIRQSGGMAPTRHQMASQLRAS
jgi:hypothetical protein